MDAEYKALANAIAKIMWVQKLLTELGIQLHLWSDNLGAKYLLSNPIFHTQTKHIEIDFHFVHERAAQKLLDIVLISSEDQIVNAFTKVVSTRHLETKGTISTQSRHCDCSRSAGVARVACVFVVN